MADGLFHDSPSCLIASSKSTKTQKFRLADFSGSDLLQAPSISDCYSLPNVDRSEERKVASKILSC